MLFSVLYCYITFLLQSRLASTRRRILGATSNDVFANISNENDGMGLDGDASWDGMDFDVASYCDDKEDSEDVNVNSKDFYKLPANLELAPSHQVSRALLNDMCECLTSLSSLLGRFYSPTLEINIWKIVWHVCCGGETSAGNSFEIRMTILLVQCHVLQVSS